MTSSSAPAPVFTRIVVGVDGHEGGDDALALARTLAAPGADLVAVAVAPATLGAPRPIADGEEPTAAAAAVDVARRALDAVPADAVARREVVLARSVADALGDAALRHDADLVVIGSSRRGPLGRILDGDDTRATVRTCPVPVAVAPRGLAEGDAAPIARIGVGWDGTPESERAIHVARGLAARTGAQVETLTVAGSTSWAMPEPVAEVAIVGADGTPPPPVEEGAATRAPGPVVDALARFAASVDLVVVGRHDRGRVARFAHGSTAETVVRAVPRPVLVVPHDG